MNPNEFSHRSRVLGLATALPVACALASLLVPTTALASSVHLSGSGATYQAAGGETNNLTISSNGSAYVFTDNGANVVIKARKGCALVGGNVHQAECPIPLNGIRKVTVFLDDEDDSVVVTDSSAVQYLIHGGRGNDTIVGDAGNDTLVGDLGDDVIDGGAGDDKLVGQAGDDTIFGGPGNDRLLGGPGDDHLFGDAGDDTISGDGDHDDLHGGDGDDVLTGGVGNDTLDGGGGNDVLVGGNGTDTVDGGAGNDEMSGGAGNDTVIGGAGVDSIAGGQGFDNLLSADGEIDNIFCDDMDSLSPDEIITPEGVHVPQEGIYGPCV